MSTSNVAATLTERDYNISTKATCRDKASKTEESRTAPFVLSNVPLGKQRLRLSAGLGDGILCCTRHRLMQVGGTWGLQPVEHGVEEITAGTRFVFGVPFHDYTER